MSRALESEQNEAISTLDCHLEDIECGKYELVFTSAENVLVKQFFFVNEKQPHRFTRVCRFASNKLWWVNLRVQLFVASKYRLRLNGRKIVKSTKGSFTQGFSFEEYGLKQISAHICGCGRGFVEAFSFLALKKNGSPFHSSALRVSSYITFSAKKKKHVLSFQEHTGSDLGC